jgi:hypothetical protein
MTGPACVLATCRSLDSESEHHCLLLSHYSLVPSTLWPCSPITRGRGGASTGLVTSPVHRRPRPRRPSSASCPLPPPWPSTVRTPLRHHHLSPPWGNLTCHSFSDQQSCLGRAHGASKPAGPARGLGAFSQQSARAPLYSLPPNVCACELSSAPATPPGLQLTSFLVQGVPNTPPGSPPASCFLSIA